MAGGEGLEVDVNPLLNALNFGSDGVSINYPGAQTLTYGFLPAGVSIRSPYEGDDITIEWAAGERAAYRHFMDNFSAIIDVEFVEVSEWSEADFELRRVNDAGVNVAGFGGYGGITVAGAYEGLITHEMGHALGLAHPFNGQNVLPGVVDALDAGDFDFNSAFTTVMAYRHGGTPGMIPSYQVRPSSKLMALDIAVLQAFYGANTRTASGDDIYGRPQATQTLWDAGGIDAIDFSAETANAIIDLRAASLNLEEGGARLVFFLGQWIRVFHRLWGHNRERARRAGQ